MLAAQFHGDSRLVMGEMPTPACPADGLLVKSQRLRHLRHGHQDVEEGRRQTGRRQDAEHELAARART